MRRPFHNAKDERIEWNVSLLYDYITKGNYDKVSQKLEWFNNVFDKEYLYDDRFIREFRSSPLTTALSERYINIAILIINNVRNVENLFKNEITEQRLLPCAFYLANTLELPDVITAIMNRVINLEDNEKRKKLISEMHDIVDELY